MSTTASPWFVYILACADNSLYTGVTTDIERRLHEHNHLISGAKYTRNKRPVTLVYVEEQPCRSTACKREYRIKQLSKAEKLELINRKK